MSMFIFYLGLAHIAIAWALALNIVFREDAGFTLDGTVRLGSLMISGAILIAAGVK